MLTEGDVIRMGKPSKGTPKDKRLKRNKPKRKGLFGGKRAKPFGK